MMILVIGADSELDDKYPEIHLRERHCGIVIVAGRLRSLMREYGSIRHD